MHFYTNESSYISSRINKSMLFSFQTFPLTKKNPFQKHSVARNGTEIHLCRIKHRDCKCFLWIYLLHAIANRQNGLTFVHTVFTQFPSLELFTWLDTIDLICGRVHYDKIDQAYER